MGNNFGDLKESTNFSNENNDDCYNLPALMFRMLFFKLRYRKAFLYTCIGPFHPEFVQPVEKMNLHLTNFE